MAVLELVTAANRDTVDALVYLLHEAQRGDVKGLNVTFRRHCGDEEALCTGAYKARPELALMALLRLGVSLMQDDPQ